MKIQYLHKTIEKVALPENPTCFSPQCKDRLHPFERSPLAQLHFSQIWLPHKTISHENLK